MSRITALAAAVGVGLFAGTAFAGTYAEDFNDGVANGAMLNGNATVNNNSLRLTENVGGQQGTMNIALLDPLAVQSFRAGFDLAVGPNSDPPADGVSFVFGPLTDGSSYGEEGINPGLVVSFDIFNNDAADDAPAIDVLVNGARVGHTPGVPSNTGGAFAPVSVVLDADGTIDVSVGGIGAVYTNLPTGFVPQAGNRFGFGARTGGLQAEQRIDNIAISTVQVPEPAALGLLALGGLGLLARRRRA